VCDPVYPDHYAAHPKYLPGRVLKIVSSREAYLEPGVATDWRDLIAEMSDDAKFIKGLQLAVKNNRECQAYKRAAIAKFQNQIHHCNQTIGASAAVGSAVTALMPLTALLTGPTVVGAGVAGAMVTGAMSAPAGIAKTIYANKIADLEEDIARLEDNAAKQEADLARFADGKTPEGLEEHARRIEAMVLGREA
jgi:hypothetical protein